MAGSHPAFDPAAFRSAIKDVMNMGLPSATEDRATFRWSAQKTFSKSDSAGAPLDFTVAPVSTVTHADVQVPVAWEFQNRLTDSASNSVGQFDESMVKLTLLDEHFALIQGADIVLLGQNEYVIQFVEPPQGLFEVTIYTIHAQARDES